MNRYTYAGNNPVRYWDPAGTCYLSPSASECFDDAINTSLRNAGLSTVYPTKPSRGTKPKPTRSTEKPPYGVGQPSAPKSGSATDAARRAQIVNDLQGVDTSKLGDVVKQGYTFAEPFSGYSLSEFVDYGDVWRQNFDRADQGFDKQHPESYYALVDMDPFLMDAALRGYQAGMPASDFQPRGSGVRLNQLGVPLAWVARHADKIVQHANNAGTFEVVPVLPADDWIVAYELSALSDGSTWRVSDETIDAVVQAARNGQRVKRTPQEMASMYQVVLTRHSPAPGVPRLSLGTFPKPRSRVGQATVGVMRSTGKILPGLSVVFDGVESYQLYDGDWNHVVDRTFLAAEAGTAGAVGGCAAGTVVGGALGSVVPVLGTAVVGGVACAGGGILGGELAAGAAKAGYDALYLNS